MHQRLCNVMHHHLHVKLEISPKVHRVKRPNRIILASEASEFELHSESPTSKLKVRRNLYRGHHGSDLKCTNYQKFCLVTISETTNESDRVAVEAVLVFQVCLTNVNTKWWRSSNRIKRWSHAGHQAESTNRSIQSSGSTYEWKNFESSMRFSK